jgi:6-phosphofructokinase 1
VRFTTLGHVQRGGAPSAFDRWMSAMVGHAAVGEVLATDATQEPVVIGMRANRITRIPLGEAVRRTRAVAAAVAAGDREETFRLRGGSFREAHHALRTIVRAVPRVAVAARTRRFAIVHGGGPAPGMNAAVRAAVRLGVDTGHEMLGVRNGFEGLVEGTIDDLGWMDVDAWAGLGGAELGINRMIPAGPDLYAIARTIEHQHLDGLLVIGGWHGYQAAARLVFERDNFPAFRLPIACIPATIDNNLPGTELCIGADTALNSIVEVVDKIKQSAVAARRCFIVEVMGRSCGYLALLSGLSTGAERVYLHEEGVTLADLQRDLESLRRGFAEGKRVGLLIRNEHASPVYTTGFMTALFEEEGHELFDVRQAILGHLQQGGNPSPFDRIQATRMAGRCVQYLVEQADQPRPGAAMIGLTGGDLVFTDLHDLPRLVDPVAMRPLDQWWLDLRPVAVALSSPGPVPEVAAAPPSARDRAWARPGRPDTRPAGARA